MVIVWEKGIRVSIANQRISRTFHSNGDISAPLAERQTRDSVSHGELLEDSTSYPKSYSRFWVTRHSERNETTCRQPGIVINGNRQTSSMCHTDTQLVKIRAGMYNRIGFRCMSGEADNVRRFPETRSPLRGLGSSPENVFRTASR